MEGFRGECSAFYRSDLLLIDLKKILGKLFGRVLIGLFNLNFLNGRLLQARN